MEDLQHLPRSRAERRFLEPWEIDKLLEAAQDVRNSTIIATAAWTGMRKGELFALTWDDVDVAAGQIRVRQSIVEGIVQRRRRAARWAGSTCQSAC